MNEERRREITRAVALLDEAKVILENSMDEETSYLENMPDSIRSGAKGTAAEEAASNLKEAVDQIEGAIAQVMDLAIQ